MAMHYENLPIYKRSVELAILIEAVVANFSRLHRFDLGADLRKQARGLAALVIKANFADNQRKVTVITQLRDQSEEMKLIVIIAKEVKAFKSFKQFQQVALLVADISKQSQGWLNSKRGKRPESPTAKRGGERAEDHCVSAPPNRVHR
ncbi:MAG: hypothetical protein ACI9J2_001632 [Saprospiraceae bacterium]|jgi:hypothetical protein